MACIKNKTSRFVGMEAVELVGMAGMISDKWLNLLVADAVDVEPVSGPNSLLTGKRTGNFAKFELREQQRLQIMASRQRFRCEFPTQRNRELFWRNRESWRENREFFIGPPAGVRCCCRSC